jgi:hypothetical protein
MRVDVALLLHTWLSASWLESQVERGQGYFTYNCLADFGFFIYRNNADAIVLSCVADPDPVGFVRIRVNFEGPDSFPGCLGSGSRSISYSHEHNKINWKGELNKEYL